VLAAGLYRRHRLVGVAYRERLGAIADIKAKLHELGVGRFIHYQPFPTATPSRGDITT
jgi:hypothetical protein